jgi:hypothetical protein
MQGNCPREVFFNKDVRTPLEMISGSPAQPKTNEFKEMIKHYIYTIDSDRGFVWKIEYLVDNDIQTRRELSDDEYKAWAYYGLVAGPLIDPTLITGGDRKREEWVYSVEGHTGKITKIEKIESDGRRIEVTFEDFLNWIAILVSQFSHAVLNAYYQGYADGQTAAQHTHYWP